jgi:hypothetical protein
VGDRDIFLGAFDEGWRVAAEAFPELLLWGEKDKQTPSIQKLDDVLTTHPSARCNCVWYYAWACKLVRSSSHTHRFVSCNLTFCHDAM